MVSSLLQSSQSLRSKMSSHRELLGVHALATGEHRQVRSRSQEQVPLLPAQQLIGGENVPLLKKGPWTAEEDALLLAYVSQHGDGNWNSVQKHSGVARCGKSCRLRWTNHLRPNLKKGTLSSEEEHIVIEQHAALGNRWSRIATMLPGRTDNEIKNFWNTRKKRHLRAGWPLYPPDVKPATPSNGYQQLEPEQCAAENGTDVIHGDGDLMSSPDSSKSSLSNQVVTVGTDTFTPTLSCTTQQTCLTFNGGRTRSDNLNPFLLTTSPSPVPRHNISEDSLHGFKTTREEQCNLTMRNTTGWPIHGFLDKGLYLQPVYQAEFLYDCNLASSEAVYHRFPYEPGSPDAKLNLLSGGNPTLFAGSHHGVNKPVATPTCSNPFSMARHDNYMQCLELELPSVQLAESADSSSTLSSPFSLSQTLPLSEVDSIGSTSNGSLCRNAGNLMDVLLLQHHHGSSAVDQLGPKHAMDQLAMVTSANPSPKDQLTFVTTGNPSPKGAEASSYQWPEYKNPLGPKHAMDQLPKGAAASSYEASGWPEYKDPLYFLGGRSLTLLNDELHHAAEKSQKSSANAGVNVDSEQQAVAFVTVKTEDEGDGGPYTDEELVTLLTFERPAHGLPITESLLEKGVVGMQMMMMNQGEETVGQSGGLEAIFGQGVAFQLEQALGAAANGVSSGGWELGLCSSSWDSMPGAL